MLGGKVAIDPQKVLVGRAGDENQRPTSPRLPKPAGHRLDVDSWDRLDSRESLHRSCIGVDIHQLPTQPEVGSKPPGNEVLHN